MSDNVERIVVSRNEKRNIQMVIERGPRGTRTRFVPINPSGRVVNKHQETYRKVEVPVA